MAVMSGWSHFAGVGTLSSHDFAAIVLAPVLAMEITEFENTGWALCK
jgi:hypothetical protein